MLFNREGQIDIAKVFVTYYGKLWAKLIDMDRICFLEFLRDVTGLHSIVAGDAECRCYLPWKEKEIEIFTDQMLEDALDLWGYLSVLTGYPPLELLVFLTDKDLHEAMLEAQRHEEEITVREPIYLLTDYAHVDPQSPMQTGRSNVENQVGEPLSDNPDEGLLVGADKGLDEAVVTMEDSNEAGQIRVDHTEA